MFQRLTYLSALFSLACLPATSSADVMFFDGEFDTSVWSVTTEGSGVSTHQQILTGGNPDEYLQIINLPTASMGDTIFGFHLQSTFVYEPAKSGAIASVEWSFDYMNIANAHFMGLALEQGDGLFAADGAVRLNSFGSWTGGGSLIDLGDLPAGLDLSASGAAITLGIFTANTFDPVFGNNPIITGYDNLSITVRSVPLVCDFSGDGLCDVTDLDLMQSLGPIAPGVAATGNEEFDLNGDGLIDLVDRDEWLALAATENGFGSPYKLGDANIDGFVDGTDFIAWNGSKFTQSLLWSNGDFTADGFVDGTDFIAWNGNKFTSSDGVTAVPEPGAGMLSLVAMLLLGAARMWR
jgi:hypothetical protein